MTIQQLAPMAPPTTYSDAVSAEIRAEVARRGLSQSALARTLGRSQVAISDRWRGRTPWALDDVQDVEVALALEPGTIFHRATRAWSANASYRPVAGHGFAVRADLALAA